MSAGVELRALNGSDLNQVAELDGRITGQPRRGFFEKRLAAADAHPDRFVAVAAEAGGAMVGYAFARIQEGEFGGTRKVAILDSIGVDSSRQGSGLGKQLFAAIEDGAKAKGASALRSQAAWSERLVGFFAAAGMSLAPRHILEVATDGARAEGVFEDEIAIAQHDADMEDHSDPGGDDFVALSRDRFPVRSMEEKDVPALVRIDRKHTGTERAAYYDSIAGEALHESGIRVSLVCEQDEAVVGFIMARVDYGEFGKADQAAVIDALGVHPGYSGHGVGHALISQLLANLQTLRVESVRTQVRWNNYQLLDFLESCGFCPSQRLVLAKALD